MEQVISKVEELKEELKTLGVINYEEKIDEALEMIKMYDNDIQRGIEHIKKYSKKKKEEEAKLVGYRKATSEEKDYTSDIKSILEHPTVVDMKVNFEDDKKYVYIFTDYIHIYDEDGNKFHGNKYEILFDFDRMKINIYGMDENYNRESCWGEGCPHPHVSTEGNPCLGDAGSMLAMTMNEYELYASYIIALNFLQQVNIHDGAGEYIYNWDCIDEDGNIIENPHQSKYENCCICNERVHEDDVYICYECDEHMCDDHAYWVPELSEYVCQSCREEHFSMCENCGELYRSENLIEASDGDCYCEECLDNIFEKCDDCGEYFRDLEDIDGQKLCDDCKDMNTFTCTKCGNTHLFDNENICNKCGQSYCNDCFDMENELCEDCLKEEREGK